MKHLPHFATIVEDLLGLVAVACRSGMQALDDGGIGDIAALLHCSGELGDGRDPIVDGSDGDIEKPREIFVGSAQQAELAGELAVRGLVENGASWTRHMSMLLCCARERHGNS